MYDHMYSIEVLYLQDTNVVLCVTHCGGVICVTFCGDVICVAH